MPKMKLCRPTSNDIFYMLWLGKPAVRHSRPADRDAFSIHR